MSAQIVHDDRPAATCDCRDENVGQEERKARPSRSLASVEVEQPQSDRPLQTNSQDDGDRLAFSWCLHKKKVSERNVNIGTYESDRLRSFALRGTSAGPVRRGKLDDALIDVDELFRVHAEDARDSPRADGRVHPVALAPSFVALC